MASRGEGPRSPGSADSQARVMTQKRLLLSDSLVWAGVILACAGGPKGNSDFIGVGVLLVLLSGAVATDALLAAPDNRRNRRPVSEPMNVISQGSTSPRCSVAQIPGDRRPDQMPGLLDQSAAVASPWRGREADDQGSRGQVSPAEQLQQRQPGGGAAVIHPDGQHSQ